MNEIGVLQKISAFLRTRDLLSQSVSRLYTDAHHTLLPYKELQPFQRFSLDMDDLVVHPDLVGQLTDGETIFAVEAKGDVDLLKGLAQAEIYQYGFHYSFLAADANALGTTILDLARRKNVGVIAVSDSVDFAHLPEARLPLRDKYDFIARQLDTVVQVSRGQTFEYNLPTHYLAWAIALDPTRDYVLRSLPEYLTDYPMPTTWRGALRGAQKLGLVAIQGNLVRLTDTGAAVKDILPATLAVWAEVHLTVSARATSITLAEYQPQSAAALRILLLNDPMVRLVVAGLKTFQNHSANFAKLAVACDQLDHARAPIFFLNSEAGSELADVRGRIAWEQAEGEHYRSKMFYQYKSILKHAGIIQDKPLGGATAKGYDPTQDLWALR